MLDRETVKLAPFYTWFETAVDRWLDIALYKAMIRIGKAVHLDNLQTVDSMVKYSSSAVDAVSVFYSVSQYLTFVFKDLNLRKFIFRSKCFGNNSPGRMRKEPCRL